MTQQYDNLVVTKLDNAEMEIRATVPSEVFATFYTKALKALGENIEIDGFRKGHAPEDMVVKHAGEARILDKAANLAITAIYPHIVVDEKIDAIGSPEVAVTKLAKDNPLEFTARTATMPEVTLPDYTKIAKDIFSKKEEVTVEEKDVDDVLMHVRRQRAQIESYEQQKADGVEQPEMPEVKDDELPELTDEFVQTLGTFQTVAEFEAKVRENVLEEKKLRAAEKKRIETAEKIIEKATIELPRLLVQQELARMAAQMEDQVAQVGGTLEDYLKHVGKTLEDLQKEWEPEAQKRAKLQLVLNTIAKKESLTPSEEEVTHEVSHLLEHYPQAVEENVRIYVETMKRNEMVFNFLEGLGK